ncbi:MAG: HAMP domain-containing histidine kinase [Pseudonocardia sp.]|nr:HAMP domain-containing histidine kinase [Pseudonocardia sp.]
MTGRAGAPRRGRAHRAIVVGVAAAVVIGMRSFEVERASRRAETRRRRLVADLAHELRSPLTSLQGYAALLRRHAERRGGPDATTSDALARIQAECARMSRMISRLGEDVGGGTGTDVGAAPCPRQVPVRLDLVAADAAAALRVLHPDRDVDLWAPQPCVVTGDPDRLRQVLDNLLGNAAAHSLAGGPVTVRVVPSVTGATILVEDTGPAPASDGTGTGRGLAIVRAIVDDHGGRWAMTSTPAGGTTVTVALPRRRP